MPEAQAPQTSLQQATQAVAADLSVATSNQNQGESQSNTSQNLDLKSQTSEHQSSAEMTFNPFEGSASVEVIPFDKVVPAAYKDKEWVKNLQKTQDPTSEFFKQFEHAQSLIGSRQGIQVPPADATPEQVKAYHKALGVPDDVKGYEAKPVEWSAEEKQLGEVVAKSIDSKLLDEMKQVALEAGTTPKAFQKMFEGYQKALVKTQKEMIIAAQQQQQADSVDFDKQADQWFGTEKAQVMDRGKRLLDENVPPQMKALLARQTNESLMLLAATLNGIHNKYIKEDGFNTGVGTQSSQASGMAARQQLIAMQQTEAYRNPMHPDHDSVVKKINEGYKALPQDALNRAVSNFD